MTKEEKIWMIESYIKRLMNDYQIMKRTSEILVLSDQDKEDIERGLEELEKHIKKIRKCKTFKEINKYIKLKELFADSSLLPREGRIL